MSWNEDLLDVDHWTHDIWVVSFKIWSRRSVFYGRVQTCRNQSNVWNSRKQLHVTLKFETKILLSDIFAQVNLISAGPTLQNLRIGLCRRQSGKSKVPAKQAGQKCIKLQGARKSNILLTFGKWVFACFKSQTWGKRICCRLRCVNAYDQQKGLEWCWNGYLDEIVQSYECRNRQWRSADAWRGNGVC